MGLLKNPKKNRPLTLFLGASWEKLFLLQTPLCGMEAALSLRAACSYFALSSVPLPLVEM